MRNERPKLTAEPTVAAPPQVHLAENHMPTMGYGGGVYKVGRGISAPTAISAPDPDYTEDALRAKKQGTCILWLIVDSTGHPRDIKVIRGLGFSLDAKAVEAVNRRKFQPALKDGRPVDVQISVEVEFHLY